CQEYNRLPRTF
nr:immunoglobulin light chain junction region [Macaca mulatta]MOV83795.1 immunoglobulin light chain junction region [Macaca mulatta]MOV85683.1 immunoglobulin light chain junction region [Macaca mulatta]